MVERLRGIITFIAVAMLVGRIATYFCVVSLNSICGDEYTKVVSIAGVEVQVCKEVKRGIGN